jgi:hypothetical protein
MSLLQAAREVVNGYPDRVHGMASRMAKKPDVLRHEIAGTGTNKLGLEDALDMTHFALEIRNHPNPLAILNRFAESVGAMVLMVPAGSQEDGPDYMTTFAKAAKEFGDLGRVMYERMADGNVSSNDLTEFDREWAEVVAVQQRLRKELQRTHDGRKPVSRPKR